MMITGSTGTESEDEGKECSTASPPSFIFMVFYKSGARKVVSRTLLEEIRKVADNKFLKMY